MVSYPVRPEEIHQIYTELAEDILRQENQLRNELPVETTAGLHNHLTKVVNSWKAERKSLRTVPVCNIYTRHLNDPLDPSLKRLLTGLDASVNVLDDIIDTKQLPPEIRISLTLNAAFSSTLMTENCPPGMRDEIGERLRDYFTALFQIPLVERQLFESMMATSKAHKHQQIAEQIYSYRSRDIDAFARIAGVATELDSDTEERLLKDLRNYRARRLLFKDISDIERDLDDDDMTPVIFLLQQYDSVDAVASTIDELSGQFPYSTEGESRYGEMLNELENPPNTLHARLSEAKTRIESEQFV